MDSFLKQISLNTECYTQPTLNFIFSNYKISVPLLELYDELYDLENIANNPEIPLEFILPRLNLSFLNQIYPNNSKADLLSYFLERNPPPIEIMEKMFLKYIVADKLRVSNVPLELVEKYYYMFSKINWSNPNLTSEFYEKHLEDLLWDDVSYNPNLEDEFIEKYSHLLNWDNISAKRYYDQTFFEKHIDKITSKVSSNKTVPIEFFELHPDKINWDLFRRGNDWDLFQRRNVKSFVALLERSVPDNELLSKYIYIGRSLEFINKYPQECKNKYMFHDNPDMDTATFKKYYSSFELFTNNVPHYVLKEYIDNYPDKKLIRLRSGNVSFKFALKNKLLQEYFLLFERTFYLIDKIESIKMLDINF